MTKDTMISLLHYTATGNDLLAVLDTIAEDWADEYQYSNTAESIEF
jgi:hypothetical protein